MSWIFGAIGEGEVQADDKIGLLEDCLYKYDEENFFIFAGGKNKSTVNVNAISDISGFVVLGLGIEDTVGSNQYSILDINRWAEVLKNNSTESLNGHFVSVVWTEENVSFNTDVIGLRDIYFRRIKNQLLFSTRVDWLVCQQSLNIDFSEFGSRWLLFNQISSNSVIKDVYRICGGKSIYINRSNLTIEEKEFNWCPQSGYFESKIEDKYTQTLKKFVEFPNFDKNKISLSLSGGLDSRVILSFLLKSKIANFDTHTFGSKETTDCKIAEQITKDINISNENINLSFSTENELIKNLTEYTNSTIVNNAGSAVIQLANYNKLLGREQIIIDGGFGEIWRREFFNRLLIKGKNALKNRNIDSILNFMFLPRADIFTNDINIEMLKGCKKQLNELFLLLPKVDNIGVENWIDLFSVYTRLRNYYGPEQSRLDGIVTSFMPFVQYDLLNMLFEMPVSSRRNGKLFKSLINLHEAKLKKYSLAKGKYSHPFYFSSIQTRLLNIILNKVGKNWVDNSRDKFLFSIKEFVMDTLSATSVRNYSPYDQKKIKKLLGYYSNRNEYVGQELDWLISFEIFRQSITA